MEELDILNLLGSRPEVFWMIVIIGAVCVIGVVDFCKCWTKNRKRDTKWIVLFVSLVIAIVLSPLVPAWLTVIIILWLCMLAVATIARNTIVDGLPHLIGKAMGSKAVTGEK